MRARSTRLAAQAATAKLTTAPPTATATKPLKSSAKTSSSPKRSKVASTPPQEDTAASSFSSPMLSKETHYWTNGCTFVVGVDEAGRGPLAGPVVVAGCAISQLWDHPDLALIHDSKKINEPQRERLFALLTAPEHSQHVRYSLAIVSPEQIDEMNILRASLFGMDECVRVLKERGECDAVLVDGPYAPPLAALAAAAAAGGVPVEAIKGGDAKVRCIAAASILAKVTRDRIMLQLHAAHPQYGFDRHKGYPVKAHVAALNAHGPCEVHRRSYAPVRNAAAIKKDNS